MYSNVNFSSGTNNFSNGYFDIIINASTSYDQLRLVSNGISLNVTGNAVYWGDRRVGTINDTYNGSNGRLRIDLNAFAPVTNANFETGDMTGWIVNNTYSGVNNQSWVESPYSVNHNLHNDSDPLIDDPCLTSCSFGPVTQTTSVQSTQKKEGTYAVKLTIAGTVLEGYGTAHGPMITSSVFTAQTGDNITVNWYALDTGDWYDVYGFIIKDVDNDGIWDEGENYQKLFHGVGATTGTWITTRITVGSNVSGENIRFIFLNGNFDYTGGKKIGSDLFIDGITLEIGNMSVANNTIMEKIVENIEYSNNNSNAASTRNYTIYYKDNSSAYNQSGQMSIIEPVKIYSPEEGHTYITRNVALNVNPENRSNWSYNLNIGAFGHYELKLTP